MERTGTTSIFGGGPSYAPHPSNAAVALVALGASFVLEGEQGPRTRARRASSSRRRATDPERENVLGPGEILVEIQRTRGPGARSAYADVRERAAFDWPLVSVAAALKIEGGMVSGARVVLGAVAPIPWRSAKAEAALVGKKLDARVGAAAPMLRRGREPL